MSNKKVPEPGDTASGGTESHGTIIPSPGDVQDTTRARDDGMIAERIAIIMWLQTTDGRRAWSGGIDAIIQAIANGVTQSVELGTPHDDTVFTLRWNVDLEFHGTLKQHHKLAIERLQLIAKHLSSIPPDAMEALLERAIVRDEPIGGITGASYAGNGDISSGWRALWSVREVKE